MNNRVVHISGATVRKAVQGCLRVVRACVWLMLMGLPIAAAAEPEAKEVKSSVKIYFKQGISVYDPDLGNNRAVLSEYVERIRVLNGEGRLKDIVVEGYVSPDGPAAVNERLAVQRSRVLADIIEQQAGIDSTKIATRPVGVDWEELRRLIEAHPEVPSRQALLDIIDNTPIYVFDRHGRIIGGRKKSLMDLRGGRPYRWMYANLFPEMRNAAAISLAYHELPPPITNQPDSETVNPAADADAAEAVTPTLPADSLTIQEEQLPDIQLQTVPTDSGSDRLKILALKTNMLYYPILMPNLELEWMFAKQWSVALEAQGAWYANEGPHKVYRVATLLPEVRYWAIERERWHGMYVGLFGGPGMYDLSNGKKGHEGEGGMVGVSAGYMWPITRHLSLDAGIGVGYMRVRDKLYVPRDGHFLYQLTKNINYVGPLRVKLSLVWRFWNDKPNPAK